MESKQITKKIWIADDGMGVRAVCTANRNCQMVKGDGKQGKVSSSQKGSNQQL